VTWEDLVELNDLNVALWDELAETFLVWCRRGGWVPLRRRIYGSRGGLAVHHRTRAAGIPETVFLLEGLGGAWKPPKPY